MKLKSVRKKFSNMHEFGPDGAAYPLCNNCGLRTMYCKCEYDEDC